MTKKHPNTPTMLQGKSIRVLPQTGGESIAEICARMAGSGPTHTELKDSAPLPSIKAPNTESGGPNLTIKLIGVLIVLAFIAYGAYRLMELAR